MYQVLWNSCKALPSNHWTHQAMDYEYALYTMYVLGGGNSNIFYVDIFQVGWNHQLEIV